RFDIAVRRLGARQGSGRTAGLAWTSRRSGQAAFALQALTRQLAGAANSLGLLAGLLFRGLLIVIAKLHLAEDAFALQLLLERAQRIINVTTANDYLQRSTARSKLRHVAVDKSVGAKSPRRRPAEPVTVGRSIAQLSGLVHCADEKPAELIRPSLPDGHRSETVERGDFVDGRSEERRVGKEGRAGWATEEDEQQESMGIRYGRIGQ